MGEVWFATDGVLSKWGFDDGDMLDDLLWDWLDDTGRIHPVWHDQQQHTFEHRVLVRVIREFVLPHVEQSLDVYEVGTIHNPIRAMSVSGVPWNDYYTIDTEGRLTPEWVEVPVGAILRIAEEEYDTSLE